MTAMKTDGDVSLGNGVFRIAEQNGKFTFVHPDGGAFLSLGVNHADETNLKYPHNIEIWRKKYGSRENWMKKGVVTDLRDWGFNTLGWTQKYVAGDFTEVDWFGAPINILHSTGWTPSELKASGMPYTATLTVAEFQDWRADPVFPDVFSDESDNWCGYQARSICEELANDKNLLGYFYVDIPAWMSHTSGKYLPSLKGLSGSDLDAELFRVASKYYGTMFKHIRRVDKNHLIQGDRFNGNKGLPKPVLDAMNPYVDVVSMQYFCGPDEKPRSEMVAFLAAAYAATGKPVLNADVGNWARPS